jgi:anaerobic selenocysteine-containing dehydrogenase
VGASLFQLPGTTGNATEVPQPEWEPGLEQYLSSACLICPSRCGIRGRVVDGRLVRIDGNPLHPLSRGGLCPRGAAGVQLQYHPHRLAAPLVRIGPRGAGSWRKISWDSALGSLAERLAQLRGARMPHALAVVAGYCAGSMDALWRQLLHAYGSANYVSDAYGDGTDAVMAAMHGVARRPAYDLDRATLVLSFGAPLFESWWSPVQAAAAFGRSERGRSARPRFVQVDTRFSRTAARSTEWVGVRPRTHAILALGIAYVLIKEERTDAAFLADHVAGYEDWTDTAGVHHDGYRSTVLRAYRTEEVSAATGVPVERIVALARAFADGAKSVAVCGVDVTLEPDGLLAGLAVHSLNVLVGGINRAGGVLVSDDPPLAPLTRVTTDEVAQRGLARGMLPVPAPFGAPTGEALAEAIATADSGTVQALLLYYANPLASATRPETWTAALQRVPFVVSFSPFLDETSRHADLIIPDLLPYERWQDGPAPASYPYPTWALARPLVEPPAGGISTADGLLSLAAKLGGSVAASLPYPDFATLLKTRARGLFATKRGMPFADAFATEHQRQMEERGWWLGTQPSFEAFWNAVLEGGGWTDPFYDYADGARLRRTNTGKVELMPAEVLRQLDPTRRSAGPYRFNGHRDDPGPTAERPLRLQPYRLSTLASGTVGLQPWLAERPTTFPDVHWVPWVEVNPATARALGLADGVMAWVVSLRGRYRARVKHFPGAARDVVIAPYGLKHPDGELANPLQLLDGAADPLTGLPSWATTFVRLERA